MNALELSIALREFRDATGYTDAEAAAVLGLSYSTFCSLKNQRSAPKPERLAEIARRLHGQSPRKRHAAIAAAEFAEKLRGWRQQSGLNERLAGEALGVSASTIRSWEQQLAAPSPRTLLRVVPLLCAPPQIDGRVVALNPSGHRSHKHVDPEFGPRLRAWRKASRLTQAEACAVLKVTDKASLSHYERGCMMPHAQRLALIEQVIAAGPALTAQTHAEVSFPQRLRAWRKARGLTQQQACAELGVSDLGHYENGSRCPLPDRLAQIEAVLAGTDALAPALADIEQTQAKLARAQSLRARLEYRLQRADRWIEQLQSRLDRRQREAASVRALS